MGNCVWIERKQKSMQKYGNSNLEIKENSPPVGSVYADLFQKWT